MDNYSSLVDSNLARYFDNYRTQRHLYKSCLINYGGDILTQSSYRLKNAKLEQKKHAERTRAPVIAAQLLTYETNGRRRAELEMKLKQLVALENVRRVREETHQRQKQKPLPQVTFDPTDRSVPDSPRSSRSKGDSKDGRRGRSQDGNSHRGSHGDDIEGRDVSNRDSGGHHGKNHQRLLAQRQEQDKLQPGNNGKIDAALSPLSQQQKQRRHKANKANKKSAQGTDKMPCHVTLHYFGTNSQLLDARLKRVDAEGDEICIKQQFSERSAQLIFKGRVKPGSDFTFLSHRTVGHPFSVSIFVNGCLDSRLSACCESKYSNSSRLGAREGHFAFVRARNATTCFRCQSSEQADYKAAEGRHKPVPNQPKDDNNNAPDVRERQQEIGEPSDEQTDSDDSSSESETDSDAESSRSLSPESQSDRSSCSNSNSSSLLSQCPHHHQPPIANKKYEKHLTMNGHKYTVVVDTEKTRHHSLSQVNEESVTNNKSKNRPSVLVVNGHRYTVAVNTEKSQVPAHGDHAGVNNREDEPQRAKHRHRKKGDNAAELNIELSLDQDAKIQHHKIHEHGDAAVHRDGTHREHERQHRVLDRHHRDADKRDWKDRRHRYPDSHDVDAGRNRKRSTDGNGRRHRRHRRRSEDSQDKMRSRSNSPNCHYKDSGDLDRKLEEKSKVLIKILDHKIRLLEEQYERQDHAINRSRETSPSDGSRKPKPMGNDDRDCIVNSRHKNSDQLSESRSSQSREGSQLGRPARPEPNEKPDLDPSNNSSPRSSKDKTSGVRSSSNHVSDSRSGKSSLSGESRRSELKESNKSYHGVDSHSNPRSDRNKSPDFRDSDHVSTPRRQERYGKRQDATTSDGDAVKASEESNNKKSAPQSPALSLDGRQSKQQNSKDHLELPGANEKESDSTDHSFWSDVSRDEVSIKPDSDKHPSYNRKAGEERDSKAEESQQLSVNRQRFDHELRLSLEKEDKTSSPREKDLRARHESLDETEAKQTKLSSRSSSTSTSSDESVRNNINKYQEALQRMEESGQDMVQEKHLSGSKRGDEQSVEDHKGSGVMQHGENVEDEQQKGKDQSREMKYGDSVLDRDKDSVGSHGSRQQRSSGKKLLEGQKVESPRTQPPQPAQSGRFNPEELDESSSDSLSEDRQQSDEEKIRSRPQPHRDQVPAADNSDDDF